MLIVSDTTPIITLMKTGRLSILEQLFEKVVLPRAVYRELIGNPAYENEAMFVRDSKFLKVHNVTSQESVQSLHEIAGLDADKRETIVLSVG